MIPAKLLLPKWLFMRLLTDDAIERQAHFKNNKNKNYALIPKFFCLFLIIIDFDNLFVGLLPSWFSRACNILTPKQKKRMFKWHLFQNPCCVLWFRNRLQLHRKLRMRSIPYQNSFRFSWFSTILILLIVGIVL